MVKKNEDLKFEEGIFEEEKETYTRPRIAEVKDAEYEEIKDGKKAEKSLFDDVGEHSSQTSEEEEEEVTELEAETIVQEEPEKLLIDGKMFLYMLNIAVPGIVWMIYHILPKKVQDKYDFDKDKLKMDDEEKGLISDGADEVARILFGKLSPIQQFFLGLATIYAMKIPDAFKEKTKD